MDNGIQLIIGIEERPIMRIPQPRPNRNISHMIEGRITRRIPKRIRVLRTRNIVVYRSSRCRCITPTVYNVMKIGNGNLHRRII